LFFYKPGNYQLPHLFYDWPKDLSDRGFVDQSMDFFFDIVFIQVVREAGV
jgi:hypothetical protein